MNPTPNPAPSTPSIPPPPPPPANPPTPALDLDPHTLRRLTRPEFWLTLQNASPDLQDRLIKTRSRTDPGAFALYFFPDLCRCTFTSLHEYLFQRRADKTLLLPPRRRGSIDVVLAPRGAAKSSLVSLVFPIHAAALGLERYIVLISATRRQAAIRLANIRSALASNGQLSRVYGRQLSRISRDSGDSIIVNDVKIDAFSAGSELRGVTHGAWRPTWIVLDDVETSARVLSSNYRDSLSEWMREVIENLGNGYTHIDLIGTLLHRDALPARLAARADVTSRTFRSVERDADRQDLWDEWRSILADLSRESRLADARAYFDARADEMLAGAQILWPEKESYYDLQLMRAARGAKAFDKEKQNAPPADGESIFPAHALARFALRGAAVEPFPAPEGVSQSPPRVELSSLRVFGFLDPALGEARGSGAARSGDFAAIVVAALAPNGYVFVLDAWIDRAPPSAQIAQIFDLHKRWRFEDFGVETNMFQKLLLDPLDRERDRRRRAAQPWDVPVREVRNRSGKLARVASMEPHIRNGWILFNESLPEEFFRQLADFPRGSHDDAPDALQGAVALARSAQSSPTLEIAIAPPRRLRSF